MGRFVSDLARFISGFALATCVVPLAARAPLPDPVALSVQTPPPPSAGKASVSLVMGRTETFEDWAVGCDNRLTCSAVALLPEGAARPYAILLIITRAGGPDGGVTLQLIAADPLTGKIELVVDKVRKAELKTQSDGVTLEGAEAMRLVRMLGSSFAFEIVQRKQVLVQPSLNGLPAALRFMDQQQGRVGARDALIATGNGNPATARVAPTMLALPVPAGPGPAAENTVAPLNPAEESAARRLAVCEGATTSTYPLEMHALDAAHSLVLLPCDAGAYNVSFVPLVANGTPGSRSFAVARFDAMPGFSGEPGAPPLVVNARWNPRLGMLSSFAKGRGLGDCGTAESYRWDGEGFRLEEARAMPVCRGAWEWPRIYAAR